MKNKKYELRKDVIEKIGRHPRIYTPEQFIIWTLLDAKGFKKADWSREMKQATKLFKEYPNLDFWKQLSFRNLDFTFKSLIFLTSKKWKGPEILDEKFANYMVSLKLRELENKKEDVKLTKESMVKFRGKTKENLKDFLS